MRSHYAPSCFVAAVLLCLAIGSHANSSTFDIFDFMNHESNYVHECVYVGPPQHGNTQHIAKRFHWFSPEDCQGGLPSGLCQAEVHEIHECGSPKNWYAFINHGQGVGLQWLNDDHCDDNDNIDPGNVTDDDNIDDDVDNTLFLRVSYTCLPTFAINDHFHRCSIWGVEESYGFNRVELDSSKCYNGLPSGHCISSLSRVEHCGVSSEWEVGGPSAHGEVASITWEMEEPCDSLIATADFVCFDDSCSSQSDCDQAQYCEMYEGQEVGFCTDKPLGFCLSDDDCHGNEECVTDSFTDHGWCEASGGLHRRMQAMRDNILYTRGEVSTHEHAKWLAAHPPAEHRDYTHHKMLQDFMEVEREQPMEREGTFGPLGKTCTQQTSCDTPSFRNDFTEPVSKDFALRWRIPRNSDGSNPMYSTDDVNNLMNHLSNQYWDVGITFTGVITYYDDDILRNSIIISGGLCNFCQRCTDNDSGECKRCPAGLNKYNTDCTDTNANPPRYTETDYVKRMHDILDTDSHDEFDVVVGDIGQERVLGYAYFPFYTPNKWRPSMVLDKVIDTITLTHEMGHALGLYHTHRGVSEVECGSACYETKASDTTGDFCADTNPEQMNFDCPKWWHKHIGFGKDSCTGEKFPDPPSKNIMSYSDCDDKTFTDCQVKRMRCHLGEISTLHSFMREADAGIGFLKITIKNAQGLDDEDSWGTSDPYVKVTVNGVTKKTDWIKNSENPTWNKEFDFGIQNQASAVHLEVYDDDTGAPDEGLGRTSAMLVAGEECKNLQDGGGKICFKIQFECMNSDYAGSPTCEP